MGDWIDFAEIRAKVTLEQVLIDLYGLGDRLRRSGKRLVGPCPIHHGDSPRAFSADLEKNVWYCHTGCRRGGNVLDAVAALDGITIREAALKLQAAFLGPSSASAPPRGAVVPTPSDPRPPSSGGPATASLARSPPAASTPATGNEETATEEGAINPPLSLRLTLAPDHPHILKDRGLALATARRFGIGYCARGLLRGTIAIPIHDEDGDIVAYAGRRLKGADVREKGKYAFPRGFRKDLVLYNLDQAKALAANEGLVLCEGFFAVMTLFERGVENAVASMGCALSDAQADLLAEHASHVSILYDGNDAGRGGALDALARLEKRGVSATNIVLPEGFVPEDLPQRLLRWAISGARILALRELAFLPRALPKKGGDPSPSS